MSVPFAKPPMRIRMVKQSVYTTLSRAEAKGHELTHRIIRR
ncbi:hypothetical protein AcetOrient_orf04087 [Acetobacter orientalis]|uniref:Uncharacterized protein n=1 Tax=Acetobacter orientalis TaxID=146474 RepID=A0A2Z5ZJV1_9PROT|nr:hypothetical protein AcetOrient_orf04087 [Acetobacter orientalis]